VGVFFGVIGHACGSHRRSSRRHQSLRSRWCGTLDPGSRSCGFRTVARRAADGEASLSTSCIPID